MSEHTPGPWRAVLQPGQTVGVHMFTHCVDAADDSIASLLTEADANLIAAAPELLVACREALDRLYRIHGPTTVAERDDIMRVRDRCRAAIAKAEGGAA